MATLGASGLWREPPSVAPTGRRAGYIAGFAALFALAMATFAQPTPSGPGWSAAGVARSSENVADVVKATSDDPRKGVCVWAFRGVTTALRDSGASWYLTWSTTHPGVVSPNGTTFIPMIRSAANVTPAGLSQAEKAGSALLTFNEPDLSTQANMTVERALSLWPTLMATNMQLASPAVATGAATPGGWLDRFMNGVEQRHYRVNFIAVHWYGADFQARAAVGQLKSYLESVHRRYNRPIWLTEYALIDFAKTGPVYPSGAQQAAFVTASVRMLDGLSFVQRYAWFALPAPSTGPSSGLYTPGPQATMAGFAFSKA